MSVFRRKRLPPDLVEVHEVFEAVLGEIEPAKEALAEVMPTTRMPGRPMPDALAEFEERLERAHRKMPAWRSPQVEAEWEACARGVDEARARAARFREEAPDLGGFEGLIWAVETLIDPLEPFAAAAERFRSLRVPVR